MQCYRTFFGVFSARFREGSRAFPRYRKSTLENKTKHSFRRKNVATRFFLGPPEGARHSRAAPAGASPARRPTRTVPADGAKRASLVAGAERGTRTTRTAAARVSTFRFQSRFFFLHAYCHCHLVFFSSIEQRLNRKNSESIRSLRPTPSAVSDDLRYIIGVLPPRRDFFQSGRATVTCNWDVYDPDSDRGPSHPGKMSPAIARALG